MKKQQFFLCMLTLLSALANAQKLSFENVSEITLRNAGVVKQAEQVKGYYFFYETDKINKKTNEYTLQVTDEKLKKLKEVKFQDKEDVLVHTSSFNGSDLLFLFHHLDEDKIVYKIFGADGNAKFDYETGVELPVVPTGMPPDLKQSLLKEAIGNIYPVAGGFVCKRSYKGGKSFEMDFYSTKSKRTWKYMPSGGKFLSATYLGASDKSIFLSVFKLNGVFDRNPDVALVCVDIESGRVLYEKQAEQPAYKFMPSVMYGLSGAAPLVVGEYFDSKQSLIKDKSLGLGLWELDENGNISTQKQISWESIFAKKLNDKGKIDGFGYLFIHDLIRLKDGDIHVIGEGYTVSGAKTYTTDMMTIKLDKNLSLIDMQLFAKQANPVNLNGGGAFMSNQTKGHVMKFEDKFDYAYMLKSSSANSYAVYYSNYERNKAYKGGTFNSISFIENNFSTDKINTKTDATFSTILPAVQGQVLLLDYYKKDKRLDLHFERMN